MEMKPTRSSKKLKRKRLSIVTQEESEGASQVQVEVLPLLQADGTDEDPLGRAE
jgi:hypothetical protein